MGSTRQLDKPKAFDLIFDRKRSILPQPSQHVDLSPAMDILAEFEKSLREHPPIAPGTADPYLPPKAKR